MSFENSKEYEDLNIENLEEILEDVQEDLEEVVKDLTEQEDKISFGDKISDFVANFVGSWSFILIFGFVVFLWVVINIYSLIKFDVYPFILLNLVLSTIAAIQAPLIMMSQRRQDQKDRIRNTKIYELIILTYNMVEQQNKHIKNIFEDEKDN